MFGSCFLKLLLRTIFENTETIIMVVFEDYSSSLNLMFSLLCLFFKIEKQFSKNSNALTILVSSIQPKNKSPLSFYLNKYFDFIYYPINYTDILLLSS